MGVRTSTSLFWGTAIKPIEPNPQNKARKEPSEVTIQPWPSVRSPPWAHDWAWLAPSLSQDSLAGVATAAAMGEVSAEPTEGTARHSWKRGTLQRAVAMAFTASSPFLLKVTSDCVSLQVRQRPTSRTWGHHSGFLMVTKHTVQASGRGMYVLSRELDYCPHGPIAEGPWASILSCQTKALPSYKIL